MRYTYYYERGAGSTRFSVTAKRRLKSLATWYFQDRFGMTINVIGLIMMVF